MGNSKEMIYMKTENLLMEIVMALMGQIRPGLNIHNQQRFPEALIVL